MMKAYTQFSRKRKKERKRRGTFGGVVLVRKIEIES